MQTEQHRKTPIHIDVWSDIACPWCYIGKRSFDLWLADFDRRDDVTVTYRSFIVSPDSPAEYDGSAFEFLTHHKGIPADRVRESVALVAQRAADVGLSYDLERISVSNTAKAHEALHFAKTQDLQPALVDRLFEAFFSDGLPLNTASVARRAAEVGLDHDEVLRALDRGEFTNAVNLDIEQAHNLGISGVPAYIINGERLLTGAQKTETFESVMDGLQPHEQWPP